VPLTKQSEIPECFAQYFFAIRLYQFWQILIWKPMRDDMSVRFGSEWSSIKDRVNEIAFDVFSFPMNLGRCGDHRGHRVEGYFPSSNPERLG